MDAGGADGALRSRPVGAFHAAPRLPGDKSVTHRAYLVGALVSGVYRVYGPNSGEDCRHTLAALRALGVDLVPEVDPHGGDDARRPSRADAARAPETGPVRVTGAGGRLRAPGHALDLGNSGTGLRLLCGVLAAQPWEAVLTGDASLRSRPMERVLEPLRAMGAHATSTGGRAPVTLRGGPLRGIDHTLALPSAQIKSAVLLAGLQAAGRTVIRGDAGSRDHTERLLRYLGATLAAEGESLVLTPSPLGARDITVPGDPSAAAFHALAAAIVPGASVELRDVGLNPTRAGVFTAFADLGAAVTVAPAPAEDPEPRGTVRVEAAPLRAREFAPEAAVGLLDEWPALAVAAAFAAGTTRVRGLAELRHKESDRLETVAAGLEAIGARVRRLDDGWEITGSGGDPLPGGTVATRGDHRVGMAFLTAGLRCRGGVVLSDPAGIATSDPYFVSNLNRILEHAV